VKETVHFLKGPAGVLEARANNTGSNNAIGIVCHPHPLYQGSMDNKVVTTIVRAFQTLGLKTIRFNFRGIGKSEGSYSQGIGEVEDLESIIRWVKENHPNDRIYLAGFSFGSYIATKYASETKIDIAALLTVAPAITHFDFLSLPVPPCPWVIIHGSKDELISLSEVKKWVEDTKQKHQRFPIELIIIEEATHFFHGCLVTLRNQIEKIIKPMVA